MTKLSPPFSSNLEKLNLWEWGIVCLLLMAITWALPAIGSALEDLDPKSNYRMPFVLSEDYWMFRRCVHAAVEHFPAVVIGDSFVWGQYVGMSETISAEINRLAGQELAFNLGVNGLHPAAIRGLIQYYGQEIRDKGVILHLNLLWMSSPERDLQGKEDVPINHPRLLPQFLTQLPSYRPTFAEKVSTLLERHWSFLSWVRHIKQLYFENMDIPNWTLLNPYRNPLTAVTFQLPPLDEGPRSRPVPWTRQKIKEESFPWVLLEDSYQWNSFQQAVDRLRRSQDRVFVLIGPFNPYLQSEDSRLRYREIRQTAEHWLTQNGVKFFTPGPLPSEWYADASHPLREGYTMIAEELFRERSFNQWVSDLRVERRQVD